MSLFALPTATYKAIPWQCGRRRLQHQLLPIFIRTAVPSTSSARPQFHQRAYTMAVNGDQGLRLSNVCDIQEKFQTAIHEFDKIVLTTKKLLVFANNFSIPVHTTTQTVAKLGPTVPALASLLPSPAHDKTKFSMYIPPIASQLAPASSIALVGIESHICITQTALDLRDAGHRVYVIADAVSSANPAEVTVALDRLRAEAGITVTTSESWMYETVGDASHPGFKSLLGVVKTSLADTKTVLGALPPKI
ncbi:unnamed protein product [Clonostachys byssicola]|uniref:Isochorismatase-like domain-containing protein n=1 Tax=Clonostachys byssicola TaxID=160290 RepID=A0A9N9XW88_9HYPO|nr:unnamed protein product [Clonostachys byssicola]